LPSATELTSARTKRLKDIIDTEFARFGHGGHSAA
jgi:hypothetical protein